MRKYFSPLLMTVTAAMMSGCLTYAPRTWVEADFATESDCLSGMAYLAAKDLNADDIIRKPRCKPQGGQGSYLGTYAVEAMTDPRDEWNWFTPKIEKREFKRTVPAPDPTLVKEYFASLDAKE